MDVLRPLRVSLIGCNLLRVEIWILSSYILNYLVKVFLSFLIFGYHLIILLQQLGVESSDLTDKPATRETVRNDLNIKLNVLIHKNPHHLLSHTWVVAVSSHLF